jgi:demethylmenaquinone methyltransferase/2-methoxy-6-polyprenyl-1,4-benzoquinol methylase
MEKSPISAGARTADETSEATVAENVRSMFDAIAPSYDRLNHLLSMGLDRRWWASTARIFREVLERPEAKVLDLCCGTGDMTEALMKLRPSISEPVTGLDFSKQMLDRARVKFADANVQWIEGDAMHLPYPDASFDLITSAFGFRNLTNYSDGLKEIARVLKPGGQVGILECNQPDGLSGAFYNLYLHHGLPVIGGILSGERSAYAYLPASIARFPRAAQMLPMMREAGFEEVSWKGYFMKAAGVYRGVKRQVLPNRG